MSVEVGIVDVNEDDTSEYTWKHVLSAEDNGDGVRRIDADGSDRMWRPVYFTDIPETDRSYNMVPEEAEIVAYAPNDLYTRLANPQPVDDGYDGLPGSISVGLGGGYGNINAGVSYSFPLGDGTDYERYNGKSGWRWTLSAGDGDWWSGPEWPTGPSNPTGEVEGVTTAQWDVVPSPKDEDEEDRIRWVDSHSRFHYQEYVGRGVYSRETERTGSGHWYYVTD